MIQLVCENCLRSVSRLGVSIWLAHALIIPYLSLYFAVDILMADAWRTRTLDSSMSSILDSQTVGIITVLAISGSVILLTLGRWKLLFLKNYGRRNRCPNNVSSDAKGLSTLISIAKASILECNRMIGVRGSSDSRKENQIEGMKVENFVQREVHWSASSVDVHDRSAVRPESTCVDDSFSKECKKPQVLKKVRFSADVIEPSGDNREYRRRMRSFAGKRSPKHTHKVTSEGSIGNTTLESAAGVAMKWGNINMSDFSHNLQQRKLTTSRLPANRMALYASMQRYRLQRPLSC